MKAKFIREGFNVLKGPSDEEMDQLYKGMSREKLSQLLNDTISKRFFDDDDYFYDEDEDTDVRLEQNFDLIERLLLSGAVVNDIETGKVEYAITEEDFELIELLKKHHLTFDADELEEVTDYALTIEMEDLLLSMAEGFNEAFKVLKGPDVSHLDFDIQDYLEVLPDNAYGARIYKSYDNTESLYWKTPPLPHDKVSKHYESEFSLEHGVIYSAAVSHRNEIIVDDEFGYSRKNLPIHTVKHFEEGLEKWDHYYNEIDWDSEKKIYEEFKYLKGPPEKDLTGYDLNYEDYGEELKKLEKTNEIHSLIIVNNGFPDEQIISWKKNIDQDYGGGYMWYEFDFERREMEGWKYDDHGRAKQIKVWRKPIKNAKDVINAMNSSFGGMPWD